MKLSAADQLGRRMKEGGVIYLVEGYGYRYLPPDTTAPESVSAATFRKLLRSKKLKRARTLKGRAIRYTYVG